MSDEMPYTNRELDEWRTDVKINLSQILEQTKKTNGRVSGLERSRAFMQGVVAVLVLLVVPILAWAISTLAGISGLIHQTVDEALQAYEIENL